MRSPSGVGYGASRAYKTAQRLQLQHSGSMHPLPVLPLCAFYGVTCAGSRSSDLRQQGRAGQLQGEVVNGPERWTYKPCRAGGQGGR